MSKTIDIQKQIEHCNNIIQENNIFLTLYENEIFYFCIEFGNKNYYSIYRKDGENQSSHEESFPTLKDGLEAWNNMNFDDYQTDYEDGCLEQEDVCSGCGYMSLHGFDICECGDCTGCCSRCESCNECDCTGHCVDEDEYYDFHV